MSIDGFKELTSIQISGDTFSSAIRNIADEIDKNGWQPVNLFYRGSDDSGFHFCINIPSTSAEETTDAIAKGLTDITDALAGVFEDYLLRDKSWQGDTWKVVDSSIIPRFDGIRVLVSSDKEIDKNVVDGCIGYALRQELGISDSSYFSSVVPIYGSGYLCVEYSVNSDSHIRTAPDFYKAFELAKRYIKEGTPIRQTDRSGLGTAGTRLINGLGNVSVTFYVR